MADFDSLESLYTHIEDHAFDYRYLIEIGDLFQKLRNQLMENGDEANAQLAQYEVDASNLIAKGNKLVAQFVSADEEGNEVQIPNINQFPEEEFNYFAQRLEKVQNPRLRARYAHILWCGGPNKRQQHAEAAIEAYLQQIIRFESLDRPTPDNGGLTGPHYGQGLLECIQCAFGLAVNARTQVGKVVPEVLRLLREFNPDSSSWYAVNYDLLKLVLENRAHFKGDDLETVPAHCLSTADQLESKDNLHGAIEINKLGVRADELLRQKTADWNRRIAANYETQMQRRERNPIVAGTWCQKAIKYYQAAGDKVKVTELGEKLEQFGGRMEFTEVTGDIDLTDHIQWCEKVAKEIAGQTTDHILATLIVDPNLLPTHDDMEHLARESAQASPLTSLAPEQVMDDRMHVVQHFETAEEKQYSELLKTFSFYMKIDNIHLIHAVISEAVRTGILNPTLVEEALRSKSWIGATLCRPVGKEKVYEWCWLDQLMPAIRDYFSRIEVLNRGEKTHDPPVMAVDSLTVKFEGILRDFAQLNGILTACNRTDAVGRPITHERDISWLLHGQRIKSILSADDLLFLKYILVEHSCLTLRHRVAHGLMNIEDYELGKLHLLFVALMRLAKYPINPTTNDPL